MTNFIPIFPLGIVVFPGEVLHLHIFEPRYIQLIHQSIAESKPFGIPTVINNAMTDKGTLVQVTEIAKEYDNGKMDIKVKGNQVFTILEVMKTLPDKLYSGAIVHYPDNSFDASPSLLQKVLEQVRQLHRLLNIQKDFKKPDQTLLSYDIAHHAGLSVSEEYEVLNLLTEPQRLEYLNRHLKKIIPVLTSAEHLKQRIQLNGHFKELKGFDLNI
ncbi:MAG: LON peptidase substrate-binding domain-containing protein [Chitinophagaceae bacterium]